MKEKKKIDRAVLKRIAAFILPYKVPLCLVMLAGVAAALCNVLIPDRIQAIADRIQAGLSGEPDFPAITREALIAGGIVALLFVFNLIFNRRMEHYAQQIGGNLRLALNRKLDRIALIEYDRVSAGDLIARMTADADNVATAISKSIGPLFQNAALFVGALLLMFLRCPPLALCVVVLVFLGAWASALAARRAMPMQQAQRQSLERMNAGIDEALSGHLVIKAFHGEKDVTEAFRQVNDRYSAELKKGQFILKLLNPVMALVNNLSYVLICLVGAWLMFREGSGVTIGTLTAFILFAKMLATPVTFFAGIMSQLSVSYVSAAKIVELLDLPEMEDKGSALPENVRGEVVFDQVRFGYREGQEIIHGFSAKVSPGMKVAIVGPTGAGKSTLVNLLMRFYEVGSGSIRIDGRDIREISRRDLHNTLGMVLQETFLFTGSLRDNLRCFSGEASEEQLQDAVRRCGLEYLVNSLPEGLDTVLSEQTGVSGGQKQLITIARAMLRDPPILILDEATSSVDTRTEMLIQQALDELSRGRTSFVIAHRLSTIVNADLIFVLKDGDIIQTGTHRQLLAEDGLYAELYASQFSPA